VRYIQRLIIGSASEFPEKRFLSNSTGAEDIQIMLCKFFTTRISVISSTGLQQDILSFLQRF
jgi:hypothetical protein